MKCLELRLPNLIPSQFVSNIWDLTFVVIYHILVFWLDARRASSTNQLITGGFFMIVASFAFVVSFFLHLVCSHNIIDRVHRPTVVKQDIAAVN